MYTESISTASVNNSTFQYEVAQTNRTEQSEASLDKNEKWKQVEEMKNISLYANTMNYDKRIQAMRLFFRGQMSADELKQCIMDTIQDTYDYVVEKGVLDEDKQMHFLNSLYRNLKIQAVQLAKDENFLEGRAMSRKYGTSRDKFAYYNSKFYYSCEESFVLFRNCFEEFAKEKGVEDYEWEVGFGSGVNPNYSFNSTWGSHHKNLKIINTEAEPPRNFIFFYGLNYEKSSEFFFVNGVSFEPTEKEGLSEKKWNRGSLLTMYDYADFLFSGKISEQDEFLSQLHYLKNFRIFSLERILRNY